MCVTPLLPLRVDLQENESMNLILFGGGLYYPRAALTIAEKAAAYVGIIPKNYIFVPLPIYTPVILNLRIKTQKKNQKPS